MLTVPSHAHFLVHLKFPKENYICLIKNNYHEVTIHFLKLKVKSEGNIFEEKSGKMGRQLHIT